MNKKVILLGAIGLITTLSNITKANDEIFVECSSFYNVGGQIKDGPSKSQRLQFNKRSAQMVMEDENIRFKITYYIPQSGMEASAYIWEKRPNTITMESMVAGTLGPVKNQTNLMGGTHYKDNVGTDHDAQLTVICRNKD